MRLLAPRDPEVASLPRRAASAVIDAACLIAGSSSLAVFWIASRQWRGRGKPRQPWWEHEHQAAWPWDEPWCRPVTEGASHTLALSLRNRRSPGMRAMGLRRVSIDGGPITAGSALTVQLTEALQSELLRPVYRGSADRAKQRAEASIRQIREIGDRHRDDSAAAEAAIHKHLAQNRGLTMSCATPIAIMAGSISFRYVIALRSPRRQTLAERFAGTIVIRER